MTGERIIVYGAPKTAKTRLVCSLPWGQEPWGDRALYIAWDPGAANLRSIMPADREHLTVIEPKAQRKGQKWDPWFVACTLATQAYPDEVRTIIWDTVTQTAKDVLAQQAEMRRFPNESVTIGTPGKPDYMVIPARGDYHAVNQSMLRLMQFLFDRPQNLIVVCHEEWDKPDDGSTEAVGGPLLAGKGSVRLLSGLFDTVIHTGGRRGKDGKPEYVARVNPHGAWRAGIRGITQFEDQVLAERPSAFWEKYIAAIGA